MNGKPTKKNEVPAEKPDNSRGSYSNTIKTLTDIWNVLAAHSSAEHPLTSGQILKYLDKSAQGTRRNTLAKHFPIDADVFNTLFPNTVLCEAGKDTIVQAYTHQGKLHVVMESPTGKPLSPDEYEMNAVFLESSASPVSQNTLNNKLPQLMKQYLEANGVEDCEEEPDDALFPEAPPISLAGVVAVRRGKTSYQYIPASQWELKAKAPDPPKTAGNKDSADGSKDTADGSKDTAPRKTEISPPRRYYLSSVLSPAEWRMLSDLILVYPYISEAQTQKFLSAMRRMAPGVRNWSGNRYAKKTPSAVQFEHIEKLDQAIRYKHKVGIRYGQYQLSMKSGKWQPELTALGDLPMVVEPYAMMWSNGYYYLVCKRVKDGGMRNLRLDRIMEVYSTTEAFEPDKSFDAYEYRDRSPVMYPGTPVLTRLRCETSLLSTLMDFFGTTITSYSTPKDGYTEVFVRASESGTRLFALQYVDRVEVLEPQSLREEIRHTLKAAAKQYSED